MDKDGEEPSSTQDIEAIVMGVLTTLIGSGRSHKEIMELYLEEAISLCILLRKDQAMKRIAYIADTSIVIASMFSKKDILKPYMKDLAAEI